MGEFIAKIDSALKRFTHDAYENHKSLWSLESVPQLGKFLYAVEDPKKQTIVKEVLSEFNAHVLARADQFAKGVIHGDCNEHNIVVTKTSPESDEFRVTGVIDFGDTCKTLYVFELAITIAYMLLQSCELETAGFVIAGYQELRPIPDNERHVLKVLGQFKPKHTPKNNFFCYNFDFLLWIELCSSSFMPEFSARCLHPYTRSGKWLSTQHTGERMENAEIGLGSAKERTRRYMVLNCW